MIHSNTLWRGDTYSDQEQKNLGDRSIGMSVLSGERTAGIRIGKCGDLSKEGIRRQVEKDPKRKDVLLLKNRICKRRMAQDRKACLLF